MSKFGNPIELAFRPASSNDLEYCRRLYFEGMENIIRKLDLNPEAQATGFQQQWELSEVQIITLDGVDVGWLQIKVDEDELFLAQIFVDPPFQRQGIGTEVMHKLIAQAEETNKAIVLAVAKINPALRLYERLGFQVADQDSRKFYIRWSANAGDGSN